MEKRDLCSWLDSKGEFHPIKLYGSHMGFALEKRMTDNRLYRNGYLRVTYYGDEVWCDNPVQPPTELQKNRLEEACLLLGFSKLVYDNHNAERILWDTAELRG